VAATSDTSSYELLRDLAVGTFKVLSHTPLRLLGINRHAHFKTRSREVWHAVGHQLAPKDIWRQVLEEPGMRSLTIEGRRQDGYRGAVYVKVEPSVRVDPGVFLDINDHFQVAVEEDKPGELRAQLADTLDREWFNASQRSNRIIEHIGEFIWSLSQKSA
jgi:hypothetical protein